MKLAPEADCRYNQLRSAMQRPFAGTLTLAICAAVFVACGASRDGNPSPTSLPAPTSDGGTRTFEMGLSSLPAELTQESYENAFALAGRAGDLVLIQRTPPWEEMISGELSDATINATERETKLAEDQELDLFVAIDPTEEVDGQSEIAALPNRLRGAGFDNPEIQGAFIAYAQYVAENYQPKYLALGIEINSYQIQHQDDFERFVILYHRAYEAVKQLSPDTLVFPTFQYEELQGLLPLTDPRPPQWNLISRFEPRIDLLAISSFPSLLYPDPQVIPDSYYAQLPSHTKRPIAIAGLGYASDVAPETAGPTAGEANQASFLRRVLANAQQLNMRFAVWFVGQDPGFVGDSGFQSFRHTGLLNEDGTAKQAWSVWAAAAARSVATPAPQR